MAAIVPKVFPTIFSSVRGTPADVIAGRGCIQAVAAILQSFH